MIVTPESTLSPDGENETYARFSKVIKGNFSATIMTMDNSQDNDVSTNKPNIYFDFSSQPAKFHPQALVS